MNFTKSILHLLLKESGSVYDRKGNKAIRTEKEDLVAYLVHSKKFSKENKSTMHIDESWVNTGA